MLRALALIAVSRTARSSADSSYSSMLSSEYTSAEAESSATAGTIVPPMVSAKSYSSFADAVMMTAVDYEYSPDLLGLLGPSLALHVEAQIKLDANNRESAPLLEYEFEMVPSADSREPLFVGEIEHRTRGAVILASRDDPGLVIKYQANCSRLRGIHPLIRDFIFLRAVADKGIAPKVHFLSPPARVPLDITAKTNFKLPAALRATCAASNHGHVRYMVMERIDGSVADIMKDVEAGGLRFDVPTAIRLTAKLVLALQQLNRQGIVHADVHWGNAAMLDIENQRIGLIDFGRSFFVDESLKLRPKLKKPRSENHCFLTHWVIEGSTIGYRDDLLMALMVGGYLMNGSAYEAYCQQLEGDVEAMLAFKRDSFLFEIPTVGSRFEELQIDEEVRELVLSRLERVLELARAVEPDANRLPYTEIYEQLQAAAALINH